MPNIFYNWPLHAKLHLIAATLKAALLSWCCLLVCVASGAEPIADVHHFERGITPNTQTLVMPNVDGAELSGLGNGELTKNTGLRGNASYVVREGDSTEPVILTTGANHRLHDFTLSGIDPKRTTANEPLPTVGVLMRFKEGTGTGGTLIDRVSCSYMGTAWQIGGGEDKMCDSSEWRGPSTVHHVNYVVDQLQSMAMQNVVSGIEASFIRKAFFRVAGGGCNAIINCQITNLTEGDICSVYLFEKSNLIGDNNWTYSLDRFKADKQCENRLELVRMMQAKPIYVSVRDTHLSNGGYGDGKYLWNLRDGARIKIEGGSRLLQKHSIFTVDDPRYPPPEIMADMVDQCSAPSEMIAPGSGPVRLTLHACYQHVGGGVQERFNFYGVRDGAAVNFGKMPKGGIQ